MIMNSHRKRRLFEEVNAIIATVELQRPVRRRMRIMLTVFTSVLMACIPVVVVYDPSQAIKLIPLGITTMMFYVSLCMTINSIELSVRTLRVAVAMEDLEMLKRALVSSNRHWGQVSTMAFRIVTKYFLSEQDDEDDE